ncbi:serine/threonine-protein kinase [Acrasis kona]|uniref:non-specific serine/threonine protein kinase n=1 Tax=Acrasis kona TaxID=1008807 RepID=A0AAW2YLD6_9EUKA
MTSSIKLTPRVLLEEKDAPEVTTPDLSKLSLCDFDDYGVIGKGAMGSVHLVHVRGQPLNEHVYAMKVIDCKNNETKAERINEELKILSLTNHRLIATKCAQYITENKTNILMEYCSGGEFFQMVHRRGCSGLPEHVAKFYAAEVLVALDYLHSIGVVYRDLKPENVLIHATGHIRLTDFDLSKLIRHRRRSQYVSQIMHNIKSYFKPQEASGLTSLRKLKAMVGTAEYIGPEVLGDKGYTAAVDWWTLGVFLYEMIYAKTPFAGRSTDETLRKISEYKDNIIIPRNNAYGAVSKECRDLICKLLTSVPQMRIGYCKGASEIKAHPFFKDVVFEKIWEQKAPITPDSPSGFERRSSLGCDPEQVLKVLKEIDDSFYESDTDSQSPPE